jgi:hypothetical protein
MSLSYLSIYLNLIYNTNTPFISIFMCRFMLLKDKSIEIEIITTKLKGLQRNIVVKRKLIKQRKVYLK